MKIPLKPEKMSLEACCVGEGSDDERWPRISIDIPGDFKHNLSVGDEVTLTVKGKVKRISQSDDKYGNYLDIEMKQADVKGGNVFEDMVDDD